MAGDNDNKAGQTETAVLAAGCFWGVEDTFRKTEGVTETEVGYTGGDAANPTYKQVCSGDTGHAEAVKVTFDPARIGYRDLLRVFFDLHDPTQLDRQGPDFGSQYRSAIFPQSDAQAKIAAEALAEEDASGRHTRPVVTRIEPAGTFWRAEDYHQQYVEKRKSGRLGFLGL